jgi:hypothetical protein
VADLAPIKERLAKCIRLFGSAERANARVMTERALASVDATWTDLVEFGKYTEAEMQEFAQAARAEGVEAGIKIGLVRASNGSGNGHLTLPPPAEMADFCQTRRGRLKNDSERKFTDEMVVATRPHNQMFIRNRLYPGQLGYLASIYIKNGGKI